MLLQQVPVKAMHLYLPSSKQANLRLTIAAELILIF